MRHFFTVEVLDANPAGRWALESPVVGASLIEWQVVPGTWASPAGHVDKVVVVVHWSAA